MEKIKIGEIEYEVLENRGDMLDVEEVSSLMTDYFDSFDYVLGDYSYDKLRLKGFCSEDNPNFKEINDISGVKDYIENFCSYKANYFLLKKVK